MSRRQLLLLDFSFALGGAALYFVAFDIVVERFGVPREMVQFQLAANCEYALYGAVLFFTRREHTKGFSWLVRMNFAYATFCLLASIYFLSLPTYSGALLLFGEALLIGVLALKELFLLEKSE